MVEKNNVAHINKTNQLQFFRFVAFLFVYLYHSLGWNIVAFPYENSGACSVGLFFVLSGWLTGFFALEKKHDITVKNIFFYVKKKIYKFYPLYFICTIFSVIFSGLPNLIASHDFTNARIMVIELMKHLCLIQSWFSKNYFCFSGVGWFLSTIMFLYIFNIPIAAALNYINRCRKKYAILGISFIVIYIFTTIYCYYAYNYNVEYWGYVFPPSRLGEYFIGAISGFATNLVARNVKEYKWNKILFTFLEILALLIWGLIFMGQVSPWRYRIVQWIIPNCILLCIFSLGRGGVSALFRSKYLENLGNISFECFLLHPIILYVYRSASDIGAISTLGKLFSSIFCLSLTIIMAYFISKRNVKAKYY